MVMFVYMNAVKNYAIEPSNVREQHMKQPSFIQKKYWSRSILRERNYVQQTYSC